MSEFTFTRKRDGTYQIDSYEGTSAVLAIPSEHEGKPVTSIADNAFSWSYQIRKVIIPDTVTQIGGFVFDGCENLDVFPCGRFDFRWALEKSITAPSSPALPLQPWRFLILSVPSVRKLFPNAGILSLLICLRL